MMNAQTLKNMAVNMTASILWEAMNANVWLDMNYIQMKKDANVNEILSGYAILP